MQTLVWYLKYSQSTATIRLSTALLSPRFIFFIDTTLKKIWWWDSGNCMPNEVLYKTYRLCRSDWNNLGFWFWCVWLCSVIIPKSPMLPSHSGHRVDESTDLCQLIGDFPGFDIRKMVIWKYFVTPFLSICFRNIYSICAIVVNTHIHTHARAHTQKHIVRCSNGVRH